MPSSAAACAKLPTRAAASNARIDASDGSRVDLQPGDCHERAAQIVGDLGRRTLGFAFVDPQAFEVRFELFQTLAQRPIDILFLFPSGIGIKRNIEKFSKTAHCKMDGLFGTRAWRGRS